MDSAEPRPVFGAGHAGAGVTSGTRGGSSPRQRPASSRPLLLIANSVPQPTRVQIAYPRPAGGPVVASTTSPRRAAHDSVDAEDPRLFDPPVSAIVETLDGGTSSSSDSMWSLGTGQWQRDTCSWARFFAAAVGTGSRALGHEVRPDACLIANPSSVAGTATLTTLPNSSFTPWVGRQCRSRRTAGERRHGPVLDLRLAELWGAGRCDGPDIVVERATTRMEVAASSRHRRPAALGAPLPSALLRN